ncbi:hypothetical protein CR513_19472, partial [Mucuna pruriens]
MVRIFSDLLEDCMEVFMDDFTVYAKSFEACLDNLSQVLCRCIDSNLVLNFGKCHFMVIEGIVLRHHVLARGIEVNKEKVDIISSLFLLAIYQEFQQDCPTSIQATIEGHRICIRLALCGCFPRVEEETHVCAYPPSTELGVSVRAYVRRVQLCARSRPRTKSQQATSCHWLCILDHGSGPNRICLAPSYSFSNHVALKFLLKKPNAKLRLVRWMLLLQEFNVEIKDKKGAENAIADNLNRLEREVDPLPIRDEFLDEQILQLTHATPWYVDIYNFLVTSTYPKGTYKVYKDKLGNKAKNYIWDNLYLWRICNGQIIRRCIPKFEIQSVLYFYYSTVGVDHYGSGRIAKESSIVGYTGQTFSETHMHSSQPANNSRKQEWL